MLLTLPSAAPQFGHLAKEAPDQKASSFIPYARLTICLHGGGKNKFKGRESWAAWEGGKEGGGRGGQQLILQLTSAPDFFHPSPPSATSLFLCFAERKLGGTKVWRMGQKQIAHGQVNTWESWKCIWRLWSTCSGGEIPWSPARREEQPPMETSGMLFRKGEAVLQQTDDGRQSQPGKGHNTEIQKGALC